MVIMSLWIMSFTPPFQNVFRQVSAYPFFVYYWTQLLTTFFNKFSETHNTCFSIDATGSIFRKLRPPCDPNHNCAAEHLFLYIAVLKLPRTTIPTIQMISENQTMQNICQWLKSTKILPNEVIVDQLSALIGAAVKAFTKFGNTLEYLDDCLLVLEKTKTFTPNCFIRLDTSHFIKCLNGLSCFKFIDKRVKMFYVKQLWKIKNSFDYDEVKKIVRNLVTVALHKFDWHTNTGEKTRCEIAKDILRNIGHNLEMGD